MIAKKHFALGTNVVTEDTQIDQTAHTNSVISTGVRKMFRLGRAVTVPCGAPGRLSTAFGSLASSTEQYNLAIRAEQAALQASVDRKSVLSHEWLLTHTNYPLYNFCLVKDA